ncbi:nicotinamide N-methylase [Aliidongia dinghuensis]|uniref:Nicotinamide N-methylase n=1 Tax=Aliidongia dinghuensis TaxID=1867774 RepID=A0A8J3E3G5_9PROT|nr:50S ribosomal protein L11 methyltransferase [Aliidongia dinghuensis]GGF16224.1 nicotinamide N-methylase [Aliidongia dinghuensis]
MRPLKGAAAAAFIREHTAIAPPSLLPELKLHLATEITPIWQATEEALEQANVPPPFWAFAWAGGQALARHVLDSPRERWSNRRVLDFGAGSGLVGIAAMKAGARLVRAAEIDPVACEAIRLNAELNGVEIEVAADDVIGRDPGADVILVGDMCYEKPLAERLVAWLRPLAGCGIDVLMGDPGRTYRPTQGLAEIARYTVPTSLELEDRETREGIVWRLLP